MLAIRLIRILLLSRLTRYYGLFRRNMVGFGARGTDTAKPIEAQAAVSAPGGLVTLNGIVSMADG